MLAASQVWFITGASQLAGLGHALARSALARGDKVILAVRSNNTEHLQGFLDAHRDTCRVLQMNVADSFDTIFKKAGEAIGMWGRVDVVVNNAGDYYWGPIEELTGDGFKEVFNTNVFGMINVANAFLPHMRTRRSGTLVFMGSRSAWRVMPTSSTYVASKAAMHGVADTYAVELKPFNIRVLNVVPGGLRTGALGRIHCPENHLLPYEVESGKYIAKEVPEYTEINSNLEKHVQRASGSEPGDPKKVAEIIADVVRGEGVAVGKSWPGSLYLGSDCESQIRERQAEIAKTLDEWRDVVRSIGFD